MKKTKNRVYTVRVHYDLCTEVVIRDCDDANAAVQKAISKAAGIDLKDMEVADVEAFIEEIDD